MDIQIFAVINLIGSSPVRLKLERMLKKHKTSCFFTFLCYNGVDHKCGMTEGGDVL
jgi:hypothetical protein